MTTQSYELIKQLPSTLGAWIYRLASIVAYAAICVFTSLRPRAVSVQLTRSEEKQRRKALFRQRQHLH